MQKYIAFSAMIFAAPLAAQTPPPADHSKMQGMKHEKMDHGTPVKPDQAMPPMDHSKMQGMDHSKMGDMGEMMKNTPANPYAEAGMAMHHEMMVVGTDASETWTRQMIEHHRGAIAMSKIAVKQAGDKEVRTMAQKVVSMQENEVAGLQSWLKRHGKTPQ
ncbi:MAG: DUF305 domain-containing protein [Blastomonas fulva]|uniref:DUF305 domain-containing protein n=1 Tax=Blastomonas fulva TaxID=1550728 RepID=UPI0040345A20